ncbi:MAG: universal stress protein [Rubrivivax sp.]|nr:universal stress protein [Rubrivivax sp.]MDP3225843.1 universal stress protein [Rubrivivax sp.]
MDRILAAIDGLSNSEAAVDAAIWAAQRSGAALEFLHVLERHPETARVTDFSGAIGAGAQESLLEVLSDDDAQRSRVARENGRALLAAARERAGAAGLAAADGRLRHGEVIDTVTELGVGAGLLVLGEHEHDDPGTARKRHLDHQVERLIRAVGCPVLVATGPVFAPPRRVALAYDGSPEAQRTLVAAATHPLLLGLPLTVVTVQAAGASAPQPLPGAPAATVLSGDPHAAIAAFVRDAGIELLVIGASRKNLLQRLLKGSTTSSLLRTSDAAVLVLR